MRHSALFHHVLIVLLSLLSAKGYASNIKGDAPAPILGLVTQIYASAPAVENTVKITVFIDQSMINRYSLGWNSDANGVPIEDGEPFVKRRIRSMLDLLNSIISQQGLPVNFEIARFEILNSDQMVERGRGHAHGVFGRLAMCFWAGEAHHPLCKHTREMLGGDTYRQYEDSVVQTDAFWYWREKRADEPLSGLAYPGVGLVVLDTYHQDCLAKPIHHGLCNEHEPTMLALLHETGHLLGATGHDSEVCRKAPSIMRSRMFYPAITSFYPDSDNEQCQETRDLRRMNMAIFSTKLPNSRKIRALKAH